MADTPLKTWLERDGRLLRLRLARPKANLIDAAMISALDSALSKHLAEPTLSCILLDAEGPHFSFGASVEEHLPEQCAAMLANLHGLIIKMLESPVPILAAVNGQCLGGGLEVVCGASRIFAASEAKFGQPEIKLAVFAPAASCLLPERIGQANAEDLLFSGRSISAEEALGQANAEDLLFSGRSISAEEALLMGLVQDVDQDPETAALSWFDENLATLSASSLRFAVRAARLQSVARIREKLIQVEKLYIDELMSTFDALEGLTAFVEKRTANWENR
jgi:cyclohexa-1,5-dienecarbonyl-CoA hydratase